jgi:hypothetical protein
MPNKGNEYDTHQISIVSRLFSPTLIRELARKGHSARFSRLAKESSIIKIHSESPIRDFFDKAFDLLKNKNNRHEYIYKSALTHKVLLGTHSLRTAVLLNEFRVGKNKADCVILNGTSNVYEIKSERDSLTRLEQQITSYRKVFANLNVITGENHLDSVTKIVPQEVGLMVLSDRYNISTKREAINSPESTNPESIFHSIRLIEAKKILKIYGFDIPNLPNTQMYGALRKIFVKLTPLQAHEGLVNVLKSTRSLLHLDEFLDSLPKSLHAAALNSSLRKKDRIQLVDIVNTPLNEALKWD